MSRGDPDAERLADGDAERFADADADCQAERFADADCPAEWFADGDAERLADCQAEWLADGDAERLADCDATEICDVVLGKPEPQPNVFRAARPSPDAGAGKPAGDGLRHWTLAAGGRCAIGWSASAPCLAV